MSLDMRSETDMKSFTRLQHLEAIPLNHGLIQDCGRRGDIFQSLANESFAKYSLRWQGEKGIYIELHI